MITGLGWFFCSLGTLAILIAATGLLRLPDALSRQHAATKAGTVAVILFSIGTALIMLDTAWTWRLVMIIVLLMFTLPLASHALSRAAAREIASGDASFDE
jgi:multicomponent Na+:H+ antiporter subunit G